MNYYSLEAVLAVGYRVRGSRGTQFRQWATAQLKEYLQKGFNLNDKALKNAGGGTYWRELLSRIRDIRSSEKLLYRQVLDLYATSVDYNPKSDESIAFEYRMLFEPHKSESLSGLRAIPVDSAPNPP